MPLLQHSALAVAAATPDERPRFAPEFLFRWGTRVLRLDYRHLVPLDLPQAFSEATRLVTSEPLSSLRTLTLLGDRFDPAAAEALKRSAAANRPYVYASAMVASGFWTVVATSVKLHGRTNLMLFDDEKTALAWLSTR